MYPAANPRSALCLLGQLPTVHRAGSSAPKQLKAPAVSQSRPTESSDLVTDLPPARRDTSMMFQSFALFPHRTVFQNVEFSLKM